MGVFVREKTIDEISEKLLGINTILSKINYLESALKEVGFSFEIKRFLWKELSNLYEERRMYEKAAKVMANKASVEVSIREKIESYISAAELYSRAGKVEDSEHMFVRALREGDLGQKLRIKLARKNVYLICAKELESKGKKASAVKFYEKLLKMDLDVFERDQIKEKLIVTYKALGLFREARLLEGV